MRRQKSPSGCVIDQKYDDHHPKGTMKLDNATVFGPPARDCT